jgi:hypothetical protein
MLPILYGLLVFVVLIAAALAYGTGRWQSVTKSRHIKLEAARRGLSRRRFEHRELDGLPSPVKRYLRLVLVDDQPMIKTVNLEQTGAINISETGSKWYPFSATQRVVLQRPGFDWEARINIFPGVSIRARDTYIAGEGGFEASVLGLLPLAKKKGTPEMARGELMRFLAEAVFYPTALLPSQGLQWEGLDASSAKARLRDGANCVELAFSFNADGLVESIRTESRERAVSGKMLPTPWEGRWKNYVQHEGIWLPLEGEVAWILPQGRQPYWRGRLTSLDFVYAA